VSRRSNPVQVVGKPALHSVNDNVNESGVSDNDAHHGDVKTNDVTTAESEFESSCLDAFARELDYLRRTLRRLGVRSSDIEDELQEVFLVLNKNWHKVERSRPLRPYLFGIAFRVVAGHRRKYRREVSQPVEDWAHDPAPGPEQATATAQSRELVLAALERVPLERRAVFIMHEIDEIPMGDVTASLSIPLFTGYSRLRRARIEFETAVRAIQNRKSLR
jgi:RNA polymerase sigma-70 factor, ECF subfamily